MLSVALRHILYQFFEAAAPRFELGEIDEREKGGVDGGEKEVGTPGRVADRDWGDYDYCGRCQPLTFVGMYWVA